MSNLIKKYFWNGDGMLCLQGQNFLNGAELPIQESDLDNMAKSTRDQVRIEGDEPLIDFADDEQEESTIEKPKPKAKSRRK